MSKELQVMTSELQVRLDQPLELSIRDIKLQVEKIEAVVREVMVKDVHYTTLPGCDRPCLLKPGAEKFAMVFRLAPSYERTRRDLPHDHREYEIICSLTHFPTGQIIGQGLGQASTMESRHRWRDEWANTQKPVPHLYWKLRSSNPEKALSLIGGRGFAGKKFDNEYFIAKHSSERRENPDIADTWNTVLKMARKRSLTDAILTCTAASDCFSREDPEDEDLDDESSPAVRQPEKPSQKPEGGSFKKTLGHALLEYCNGDERGAAEILQSLTGKRSCRDLTEEQAKDALADFQEKYGQPVIP